ncbi:16S rRNA (cytosine(1402)-N(4))-methyltransferase RsmH [Lipingzhangella sp. LS1_29]|uniref:Ribosomal RNA small subunit methyltransferase H n=1 Tax=Lipingzhangella rawalii TaxID=2055835 RepID=A0ABU2H287_9ACTN|nr:16S rRNA (cytosine(1402)-N(4))-methyltransferase RsmH [Lipingzhangella rawalii]MDS1269406.1 16S rRNA (cytosine(1402)-N(4))-methyltransferase RsmH [Lipingzhangella rawalii]
MGEPSADRVEGTGPAGHVPVLAERTLQLLSPALEPSSGSSGRPLLVDATIGRGGHAEQILRTHPHVQVLGIDRDPSAVEYSRRRLASYGDRVEVVHAVYDELDDVVRDHGHPEVSAVLLDLGVSSPQLDEPHRGFAYSYDAPLDMRMDTTRGPTAAEVVNTASVAELTRILRDYGEERFARRIAQAIQRERARRPIESTSRLATLVQEAIPAPARRTGGNPAKRTFQALRIEVNDEIATLERALPPAVAWLGMGGRIVVLSYHSLEDRAVKRVLSTAARDTTPPELPVSLPERQPQLRLLTRGAEQATAAECEVNPRAASVRLRAAERIRPAV